MTLVREDRARFTALVRATSEATGLLDVLVEKDYWAVEALRAVREGFDVTVGSETVRICPIFKGGTSLSKAYALVHRFSEDVDLLIPVLIGEGGYSQKQRTDVMRACTEAVSDALGIEGERGKARKGVDRHWLYPYAPVSTADVELAGVNPAIRVEVTVMGGAHPHSPQTINSLVATHASEIEGFPIYQDLAPVVVDTLAAERTLVEKLAMLHDAAHQAINGNTGRLASAGRHYYDVAQLLGDEAVQKALSPEWVAEIAADADRWSSEGNYPFTPRPDRGFAASPAFTDPQLLDVVRSSFDQAMQWVWTTNKPTLEECVATVASGSDLL